MRKKQKVTPIDIENVIMAKVKSSEISMKPRWYFVLGSLSLIVGLVAICIGTVFLTNLTFFLVRKHGPMGQWRLETLLDSFPVWVPFLATAGTAMGIWMLKKYDFSYKKNFVIIMIGFIISVLISAYAIDSLGLNDIWSTKRPVNRIYQQINRQAPAPLTKPTQPQNGKVKGIHRQNL
jgi:hypothetical protein